MIAGRNRTRRHGYGLEATITSVGGRPVRSLSAGRLRQLPEVVVLPGLGAPGYLLPWADKIAAWTKVTFVDLPGWSKGRARSCSPNVEQIARAAVGWLDATSRDDVVLLGHSTGANAARRAALLRPDRLSGLVLAGPVFEPAARPVPAMLRRTLATLRNEVATELAAVAPDYLASGGHGLVRLTRSALADMPETEVGGLTMPVLIMTGRLDRLAPPDWAGRLAESAGASCIVLPGAHNSCFTYPSEADAALHHAVDTWSGGR